MSAKVFKFAVLKVIVGMLLCVGAHFGFAQQGLNNDSDFMSREERLKQISELKAVVDVWGGRYEMVFEFNNESFKKNGEVLLSSRSVTGATSIPMIERLPIKYRGYFNVEKSFKNYSYSVQIEGRSPLIFEFWFAKESMQNSDLVTLHVYDAKFNPVMATCKTMEIEYLRNQVDQTVLPTLEEVTQGKATNADNSVPTINYNEMSFQEIIATDMWRQQEKIMDEMKFNKNERESVYRVLFDDQRFREKIRAVEEAKRAVARLAGEKRANGGKK